MTDKEFKVTIREENEKIILDLKGVINRFASDALTEAYEQSAEGDDSAVVLNFEGVDYINSTGIAVIVSLLAQARQAEKELIVFGLTEHYLEIFKITRLADFMVIHESEEQAIA